MSEEDLRQKLKKSVCFYWTEYYLQEDKIRNIDLLVCKLIIIHASVYIHTIHCSDFKAELIFDKNSAGSRL
jgi:hypothetical protein